MYSFKGPERAKLKSISLAELLAGNVNAVNDLLSACQEDGYFYLGFDHGSTCSVLEHVDNLIAVGNSVFKLPLKEKEQYSTEKYLPSRLVGYKRAGCSTGPFPEKKDGYESFLIHNNGVFGQDGLKVPQAIEENLQLVKKFLNEVHGYSEWILSTLSKALALPYDLKDCHRKDKPSSANLAMLKYLPYGSGDEKVGNMAHTDLGTLSIIFSQIGGLQVMLPESEEWGFVEPRAGHAVVIVGDSLRFLSNYVLRSCLHRVVPPPNATGQYKFSLVYNLRPEFDAKFTAYGRRTNSLDWHNQKYALFREAGLDPERHFAMLTGRETYTGLAGQ